ncbi:MAG: dihydrofolate reductase family protein [Candidatus Micrarchaeota archaeon]
MSEVILYIAYSLDGFIAKKDGSVGWLDKYDAAGEDYGFSGFYKNIGASIMGATTYLQALDFKGGIDPKMPTYVVTHRKLDAPDGMNVQFYSGDLKALVADIRKQTKKDIWLVGGGKLAREFLREGLVDRIIISVIPEILGDGIPLFGILGRGIRMKLEGTRNYKSGIVQMEYVVEGKRRPR